jgi:predicted DNA-binding transcriptional regulator AlpA
MNENKTIKKYYRAKEVAIYLGIGIATVWRYAKLGKLTPKKLSSHITVFHIDEIKALVS